jgi:hypothetical protein
MYLTHPLLLPAHACRKSSITVKAAHILPPHPRKTPHKPNLEAVFRLPGNTFYQHLLVSHLLRLFQIITRLPESVDKGSQVIQETLRHSNVTSGNKFFHVEKQGKSNNMASAHLYN